MSVRVSRNIETPRTRVGTWAAGQGIGLIEDTPTCAELVGRLMAEAEATIRQRLQVRPASQPAAKID
jgi:NAD(P)H-dependent flavin oxidoreductase YrpB (nitropropane dioxygenase family)